VTESTTIRRCRDDELDELLGVVNAAATAYAGAIPDDCYHVPYMPPAELRAEIAAGVRFWGRFDGPRLIGVMGIQDVADVTLLRHAYVRPGRQRRGVGGELLVHLCRRATGPLLVGTWAGAGWAIRFYERHGFRQVDPVQKDALLRRYWSIPERQVETSVVLRLVAPVRAPGAGEGVGGHRLDARAARRRLPPTGVSLSG